MEWISKSKLKTCKLHLESLREVSHIFWCSWGLCTELQSGNIDMNFAPCTEVHRNPWSLKVRKQCFWDDFFLVSKFGWVSNSPCVLFLCLLQMESFSVFHQDRCRCIKKWNQMLNSEGTTIILACYLVCKHEVGLAAKLNIATFVACYWHHFMRACIHQTTNDGYLWCSIFCNIATVLSFCFSSLDAVFSCIKTSTTTQCWRLQFWAMAWSLYKSFGHIKIPILVVTELTLIKLLTSTWS
jgi:hypothetical protein